ncbi:MAG: hypothetical protein WAX69_00375 [Victivallales bacterium]
MKNNFFTRAQKEQQELLFIVLLTLTLNSYLLGKLQGVVNKHDVEMTYAGLLGFCAGMLGFYATLLGNYAEMLGSYA